MTTPTFNKFKSTTIYGNFNNVDYPDNSVLASAYFQRNLTISGDLTCSGIIYGKKLFYDNVDISSTFVSNLTLSSTLSNYTLSSTLSNYALSSALTPYALSSSLDNYALLSGATFSGNVSGLTAATSDNSNTFATTAFVKAQNYVTSNPDLSPYALLSGAFFTGNVSGLTAVSTDNSNKLATTAFVKSQGYINNGALSPYALLGGATFTGNVAGLTALSTDNSNKFATTAFVKAQNYITSAPLIAYALLNGATFTGALNATTQATSNNSTLVATTAYVKGQNYITSSALSPYALSSTLNNYALLSGATFTGTVNLNNGFATPTGKDVFIGCNNTFPTTNSGAKTGLGFYWNQSGGVGEVNLLCYGQGGMGGLSIWNSNVSNVPNKLVEFFPSGSVFTTTVNGITPTTSDNSTQFATTAWVKLQNYLTSSATPTTVNNFVGLTITFNKSLNGNNGVFTTTMATAAYIYTRTLNGVSTVSIGWQPTGFMPSASAHCINTIYFTPDGGSQTVSNYCVLATLNGPAPTSLPTLININMYQGTNGYIGTQLKGYGAIVQDTNLTTYSVVFISYSVFALNTQYCYDPFSFVYE